MSDSQQQTHMEDALPEQTFSMRFGRLIMKNRFATLMTLLSIAFFFATPLVNAFLYNSTGKMLPGITTRFHLDTSIRDTFPEHPFIHAQDKFTGRFGTASYVSIAVVKKDGEIYDTDFLEKVERITRVVDENAVRQSLPSEQCRAYQHACDHDRTRWFDQC